jgi:hypothetical protein
MANEVREFWKRKVPSGIFAASDTSYPVGNLGAAGARRELYGWLMKLVLAVCLGLLLILPMYLKSPRLLEGADVTVAASIIGVAIIFAAVLVPCVLLIVARFRDVTEMLDNAAEIKAHIERGAASSVAIRRRFELAKLNE